MEKDDTSLFRLIDLNNESFYRYCSCITSMLDYFFPSLKSKM